MAKDKNRKADKKKKAGKKASQLAIRVEKSERDAFVALCDALDTSAAREIRRFMREFVSRHNEGVPASGPADPPEPVAETPVEATQSRPVSPVREPRAKPQKGGAPARAPRRRKAAPEPDTTT